MRFDIGLGFFKGSLLKAAKNFLPKKPVAPSIVSPTGDESFSPLRPLSISEEVKLIEAKSDDVKDTTQGGPFEVSNSRAHALDKDNPHQAYNRVLGRVFSRLDDHQKEFFAKLFPSIDASYRKFRYNKQHEILSRYLKMKSFIQFLTTPTADTPGTCLLLHFDDKRYLVGNVHEGLQRAGIQFGARFTKVQDIFVTGRTEWKTTGGLLGMVLTLADSTNASSAALVNEAKRKLEKQQRKLNDQSIAPPIPSASAITAAKAALNIHGGPNLTHLFATARMFVFRKGVPLEVHEDNSNGQAPADLDRKPDWTDENIQVWNMAIAPSNYASSPQSPRKRSFNEFAESEPPEEYVHTGGISTRKLTDQEIRRHVVAEMFHSNWHLDNLEERPLSSIDGPATIFIRDPYSHKLQRYYPPLLDSNTPLPDINVLVRKKWPGAAFDELPKTKPSPIAMSYIIRNHRQRGKFMTAKAMELKVKKGPLWAQLSAGNSVQSEDGNTVTPDMVLAEGKEGGGIAVVDLPDAEYVESLINRPEWKSEAIMTGVGAIIWLLGTGVGQETRLQTFMNDHPQWKHIISSPNSCPNYLAMSSSANSAIRLNQINQQIFPIPVHDNKVPTEHGGELSQVLAVPEGSMSTNVVFTEAVPAQQGLTCQLEPSFEVQGKTIIPFLDTASTIRCISNNVLSLARTAREEVATDTAGHTENEGLPSGDAEIITLGTGSALPSKYRNVSSTLLRVPGSGSYLLDCGENTLGQLQRVYGEAGLKEILRDLRLIWISHLHADHHLGTVSVIKAWRDEVHGQRQWTEEGNSASTRPKNGSPFSAMPEISNPVKLLEEGKRLIVTGTGQMMDWLKEYADVEDYGYNTIIPLESVAPWSKRSGKFHLKWHHRHVGFGIEYPKINDALKTATGLADLEACQVPHCWNAQAVSLTFPTGFKFSYSGDCRPSQNFVKIGKGSTVLLHEATFDDELQGDAEAKKHSTTSEAIGVGLAMGARRVILTHFSQRYQKIPIMDKLGLKHVKLETAEENAESDIPVGTEVESLPTPEDIVMQDREEVKEVARSSGSPNVTQESVHIGEPQVEATEFTGSQSRRKTSGMYSRRNSQSESEVFIAPEAAKHMKVCVAFDYMRIKVKEIAHMEKFTPALLELYQQDEEADNIANLQQEPEKAEKKKKRKDESDDESSKGNIKKSNEEIHRGKSNRQIRKEQRRTNNPEKDKGGGKQNSGVSNTATMRPSLSLLPLLPFEDQDKWWFVNISRGESRSDSRRRHRRIGLHLAALKETNKQYCDFIRIYNSINISTAYTTLAILGEIGFRNHATTSKLYDVEDKSTRTLMWRNQVAPNDELVENNASALAEKAPAIERLDESQMKNSTGKSTPWESMRERRLKMASRKSRRDINGKPSIQKQWIHKAFQKYRGTSPVYQNRVAPASSVPLTPRLSMSEIGVEQPHIEEQPPTPVHSTAVRSGARIRVGGGPNGRIIHINNLNSLSPIDEAAQAISTSPTKPEMQRHILPSKKPKEKPLSPMAAFPSRSRTTSKRVRRVRSHLQPNWDLTLENVANEVEGDFREAKHTALHKV